MRGGRGPVKATAVPEGHIYRFDFYPCFNILELTSMKCVNMMSPISPLTVH